MVESAEQDYFFLSSLPRTGSTLLSSILNQNRDIWVTPHTATTDVLKRIHQDAPMYPDVQLGNLMPQHMSLLRNALAAMYSCRPERYIIDYSRMWGSPYFYALLTRVLDSAPKIIVTVRPLEEIVASLICKAEENPATNFIDREMRERDFWPYHRKSLNDARVDYLLSDGSLIQAAMLSLHGAFQGETADSFYVIRYEDLVNQPKRILDSVYSFLQIPTFDHSFTGIVGESQNDIDVLGIKDMHAVRAELEITSPDPSKILSDYAITRCILEDFWTER